MSNFVILSFFLIGDNSIKEDGFFQLLSNLSVNYVTNFDFKSNLTDFTKSGASSYISYLGSLPTP